MYSLYYCILLPQKLNCSFNSNKKLYDYRIPILKCVIHHFKGKLLYLEL